MVCGMADVFQMLLQNGRIEVGFLGGAQVDRYGNINTTVIGDYEHPKVRLPGSGGAPEIAIHAKRTLVIARLDKRAFPEKVDFITSPGHRARGGTRRSLKMPGAGPVRVITDRGTLAANPETGELELDALYPGTHGRRSRSGRRLGSRRARAIARPSSRPRLTSCDCYAKSWIRDGHFLALGHVRKSFDRRVRRDSAC